MDTRRFDRPAFLFIAFAQRDVMKVLVTGNLPDDTVAPLKARYDVEIHPHHRPMAPEAVLEAVRDKHGLLCMITDPVNAALLKQAPQLKIIANFGVGYNNIDVAAATQRRIMVTNTPGVLTDATADLAMALVLAMGRRLVAADHHTRNGQFKFWAPFYFLGNEITGKTLGIIGMGRIGEAVARRAAGFDMTVLYHNRNPLDAEKERQLGVRYTELERLLQQVDYLTLHVPLTPGTHHLIGARELAMMKPSAFLINTARGPVVDEQALLEALQAGRLAGAGLDVYENEPRITAGLELLNNVVLLPHVGSATVETRRRMATLAVDNLLAGLEGRTPPNCLNCHEMERS
jgi:glyoxylate reductase